LVAKMCTDINLLYDVQPFFDNQLAFSETWGANIGQLDLDTELCNHRWSTIWPARHESGRRV
jgi:hypothetical protein